MWRCENRTECRARIITNQDFDREINILGKRKRCTHDVETVKIKVKEVVRGIKRRADEQPNTAPSAIYRQDVSN